MFHVQISNLVFKSQPSSTYSNGIIILTGGRCKTLPKHIFINLRRSTTSKVSILSLKCYPCETQVQYWDGSDTITSKMLILKLKKRLID